MIIEGSSVLVTGGAGFIGSHLTDLLLKRGCKVTVLDDFSSGSRDNIQHHQEMDNFFLQECDITDYAATRDHFQGIEYVFHLACRNVRLSLKQPTIVHEVNTTGTLNVLKSSAAHGVKRFLYCSSSEVNGTAGIVPMPEDYNFAPETIYGASKLAGEYYTQVFQRSNWLETVIARPHNNYGPREHYRGHHGEVIPRFILLSLANQSPVIYGKGDQTRDFTYVTETASYLVRLLECDEAIGQTVNICRGQEVSINEIAELIIRIIGNNVTPKHIDGRPNDVLRLFGDPTKLKNLVNDSPSISIREGLEKTISWFRANVEHDETLLASLAPQNWLDVPTEDWLKNHAKR